MMALDATGTTIVTDDVVRYGEEPGEGVVTAHEHGGEGRVLVLWNGMREPEWELPSHLVIVRNWSGR
jgi:hypothetical protein